jgi:hypothetical protein
VLTHNSAQTRTIRFRAVSFISVSIKNIYVRMLGYQRKNKEGNLSEFGMNLISNNV